MAGGIYIDVQERPGMAIDALLPGRIEHELRTGLVANEQLITMSGAPAPAGSNKELREDGTFELREDGTFELRE